MSAKFPEHAADIIDYQRRSLQNVRFSRECGHPVRIFKRLAGWKTALPGVLQEPQSKILESGMENAISCPFTVMRSLR